MPIGYLYALKRKEDKDYFQRFGFIIFPKAPEHSIWFHCASVGETRSLKSITDRIKKERPDISIIISTNTATGKSVAEKEIEPYLAFLIPFENPMAYRFIMSGLRVKALFIVDTELWPNLISTCSKYIKLYLINARISDKSFRSYKRLKFIFKGILNKFTAIYTKSPDDFEKFKYIKGNSDRMENFGNMKFYSKKPVPDLRDYKYLSDYKIFMAASTHKGEEDAALDAFSASDKFDKLILAPRHMFRLKEVMEACKARKLEYSLLSKNSTETKVIIVDSFGKLEYLFNIADKIFIGGSIAPIGGHNLFEALQFSKKVCCGSNMGNFQEIYYIGLEHNVVETVNNSSQIAEYINREENNANFDSFFNAVESESSRKLDKLMQVINDIYSSGHSS